MSLVDLVLKKVKNSTHFPVIVTNKEFPIIQESYRIADALENQGYKVETFSNLETGIYGFRVDK